MLTAGMMSCQDTLEEQYINPEKTQQASIGKFFTRMLDNRRVRPDYWHVRTLLAQHTGVYTNTLSYLNSPRRFQQQLNYLDDLWKDYYTPNGSDTPGEGTAAGGIMPHMREIEKTYNSLSAEAQKENEAYLHAARIVFYDQTAQMVDMWGDIPYFDAGGLNLLGATKAPKFDAAADIYADILEGLETSAAFFATANLDPLVASAFSKQDILMKGSVSGWRRYANSLRLRLLMRISFQNENKAQADVMEMLGSPAQYPLVEETEHNILLASLTNYTKDMSAALTELNSNIAPAYLLDEVLKPANDPRIRALFDKNAGTDGPNADYNGMPADIPSSDQEANIAARKYAVLDSTTFLLNNDFPGIVFTASEVNFLKAEAFERWGTTADAQAAYEKAVRQAVDFVYYLNELGATFRKEDGEAKPTTDEMNDFITSPTVAYTGTREQKLEKIWTQKWVSLGFMQSIESWAEFRRTGYPALTFVPDNTPDFNLPPSRFLYPSSEKVNNAENYSAVSAKDNTSTTIFWDVR